MGLWLRLSTGPFGFLSGRRFHSATSQRILLCLGYTGWIGVILFFLLQREILRLLWRVNRTMRDPFGVPFWVAMMTYGMFFPLGETPYGAVPFYLILGWLVSPLLHERESVPAADDAKRTWHFTIDDTGIRLLRDA